MNISSIIITKREQTWAISQKNFNEINASISEKIILRNTLYLLEIILE